MDAALRNMFGYEEDKVLGLAPSTLLAPHDQTRVTRLMHDQLLSETETRSAVCEGIRKDGTTFPLEMRSRRIDFEGQAALLIQLRDLTERRRDERALRDTEARYRSLVENALAGVAVSQDHRFTYVNPKFAEIVGYTQDELYAFPHVLDLVLKDDKPLVEEKLRQRTEGEVDVAHYTARVRRKDGRIIVAEVNGAVMSYRGRPAIISTLLDVTERHRASEQMRASEKRFRTLFEEVPIGMVMASTDTRIERVNDTFCQMLGYTAAELVGRSIVDITHPDDPAGSPESAARVFENAQRGTRVSKRYVRKDGTIVQAETTVAMISDHERDASFAVAMVEDVRTSESSRGNWNTSFDSKAWGNWPVAWRTTSITP